MNDDTKAKRVEQLAKEMYETQGDNDPTKPLGWIVNWVNTPIAIRDHWRRLAQQKIDNEK